MFFTSSSSESRIDCFVINTSPIRSDIEFISRRYWESLTYSLRASILKDITELQDFLNTSSKVLQTAPMMDEMDLDDAGGQYERIINELPNVRVQSGLQFHSTHNRNTILVFADLHPSQNRWSQRLLPRRLVSRTCQCSGQYSPAMGSTTTAHRQSQCGS